MPFVPSSFLLLVVRPGAPSSVLVPSNQRMPLAFPLNNGAFGRVTTLQPPKLWPSSHALLNPLRSLEFVS